MGTTRKGGRKARKWGKRLTRVIDPELAKVLSHEIRGHILATLGDRIASPSEIAREIDVPVMEVSYHVRELRARKLIKLVRTEKRRGFREHFYTLSSRVVHLDDSEWQRMPEPLRVSLSGALIQTFLKDAAGALRAGTLNARNNHQSRTTMILDEHGCKEVTKLMDEALEKVLAVGERCAGSFEKAPAAGIPFEVFMIGFETAAGRSSAGIEAKAG